VYAPSGAGGVGPYAFTFEILANTDIAVFKDNTLLTLTTHYTVTINANGTGSVTITAAGLALSPTSPTQYAIVGNRTIARATDFTTGGDFFANTINDELDQQTIFAQQNAEGLNRALQAPQTDPITINMTLPAKATRASKTLAFDADGNPTPGVSAADVANAVTYATNAANSATAAASSASSASSSATAASGSASTASTQASNASTSATNASNSASSASTSATNAAASASTATTQASNASTSATNAASSASAASTSASNAATSATNASNSASTASTQASNAATSATAASGSATSAASSAAAAASALDSFDDRYLGTKTSDPTLDNDGNALVAGALYFSTTQNVMKVYDGASWITATSAGATSLLRFRYVATSGQTTFSGADAASATLTYTVNNIAVHRNGVTLDTSEYTASNGTSIVLTVAAGTGDIVDIIAFKSFTVADALSAVSGGTVNGGVNITGNVGIGTASPSKLLQVTNADSTVSSTQVLLEGGHNGYGTGISFQSRTSSGGTLVEMARIVADGEDNWNTTASTQDAGLRFYTTLNGTSAEKMRINSSGNVGIGVTPSGWGSSYKAQQIGQAGVLSGHTSVPAMTLTSNAYENSGWKAITTSSAHRIDLSSDNNATIFYRAPSVSAGSALTWSESMRIDSSGNLLVGATASANSTYSIATFRGASKGIAIQDSGSGAYRAIYIGGGNNLYFYNGTNEGSLSSAGAWVNASDARLKNSIVDIKHGLSAVMNTQPRSYKMNDLEGDYVGFVAQELQEVIPEVVSGDPEKQLGVDYGSLVAVAFKAIQEQQALITTLTDRITALENA
jgi:hypothetical protein